MNRSSFAATLGALGIGALLLTGCTAQARTPGPSNASPSPTQTPSVTPASDPVLQAELGASDNLSYFDFVNTAVLEQNPAATGRNFVDALVAAGFTKADMEVTLDQTSVGLAADSVQWAVRFTGECLIGQTGPASGGYHSQVAAMLGTGTCLVGATRPIDW
ncbi:DUF6993 domain-containing protein [Luethyella okanaganae]|uniref:DUF6993 domain-containing protein n=1 Tax=Luethyella okanaganae TaxID=69372 RepID=A0ABW1VBK9_9MICO